MVNFLCKILFLIIGVLIFILSAFIVSWQVFKIPTPLSDPVDCMPRVFPDHEAVEKYKLEKETNIGLRERLFGSKCVTW